MRILQCVWSRSWKQFMIYRATGCLTLALALVFYGIELLTGYIYFSSDVTVKGWDRTDYLLLVTTASLIMALYNFLFVLGHEQLSEKILTGALDQILLRPVDPYWLTAFGGFDIPSLFDLGFSLVIASLFLSKYQPAFLELVWYFLACLLGVCVVFLLNQLCIGCAFWIVRTSALSGIVEDLVGIFSRPRAFFPVSLQIIFTWLIPILTVTNLPVLLLKRHAGLTSLSLLAGLTVFLYIVSRWQWKLGLKRYSSAA